VPLHGQRTTSGFLESQTQVHIMGSATVLCVCKWVGRDGKHVTSKHLLLNPAPRRRPSKSAIFKHNYWHTKNNKIHHMCMRQEFCYFGYFTILSVEIHKSMCSKQQAASLMLICTWC